MPSDVVPKAARAHERRAARSRLDIQIARAPTSGSSSRDGTALHYRDKHRSPKFRGKCFASLRQFLGLRNGVILERARVQRFKPQNSPLKIENQTEIPEKV